MRNLLRCFTVALVLHSMVAAHADPARFDLAGPSIDIRVTRAGISLPIAAVPSLQPGDEIWLHPALPATQSVHYLLIAAFLRGTTNPPPPEWFTRIETWKKTVREEGVSVTVPAGAEQAILFLAPETGGDFSTLRSAVRGRPGIFVRASQDLTEAGFEQARIEKYVSSIKLVPPSDQAALLAHSNLLARTLDLQPNESCFKRPQDQQYNCLTQTGSQTLLEDGHAQTIVASLSTGSGSDFINAASNTSLAGGGTYSAYVGALVDFIRIMNSVHTAQYQYIPAIAFPEAESLNLRLNTAPSFHNPKSVLVIGMPAIQASVLPPLRPADPNHISCLLDPRMVLPVEGAPLVFSTSFAHHLMLHLDVPPAPGTPAHSQEIPLVADAYQGGLTVASAGPARHELAFSPPAHATASKPPVHATVPSVPGQPIMGTVHGFWGFDPFSGPAVPLQQVPGEGWRIVDAGETDANLILGQPNHLKLLSSGTACVRSISLEPGDTRVEWKLSDVPEPLAISSPQPADHNSRSAGPPLTVGLAVPPVTLTINLQPAEAPGSIRLSIQQFGRSGPDQVGTKTFAEPAKIEVLHLHLGDSFVSLTGKGLDQVASLSLKKLTFLPEEASGSVSRNPADPYSALMLALPKDVPPPSLKLNEKVVAEVHLRDGRTLAVPGNTLPARPAVTILSRRSVDAGPSPIKLSSDNDLPLGGRLVFSLKSKAGFPRSEQIEIANPDESLKTTLSIASSSIVLENAHTVLATFDPLKAFGPSAFGSFRLRAVAADGSVGDWLALANIVRLPTLTGLHCPSDPTSPCMLSGSDLYLIDSVGSDAAFTQPTQVPEGFVDTSLSIPRPIGPVFFLRLRDDPSEANAVSLPVQPELPAPK